MRDDLMLKEIQNELLSELRDKIVFNIGED